MKIMFVNWGLAMGGAEVIAASYLSQMKKDGYDVSLMELMHRPTFLYQEMLNAQIPVYSILHNSDHILYKVVNKFLGHEIIKRKSRHYMNQILPDIIHLQAFSEYIDFETVDLKKVFLTIHSDLNRYLEAYTEAGRRKLRKLMEEGMHVVVLSEKARKALLVFCPSVDVHVIPNGLDIDGIKSQCYDKEQLCREWHISNDAFILGHVGRFNKVKNHAKLIDIFDCLHKKQPNSVLLLIGNDTKEEGGNIHKLVADRGLVDCVKFLGIRSDATALMSCFDAFALTSFQECFSLVSIEAQAHGVRCVLSDQVPDEVVCNDNCFTMSIHEPSEKWADLLLGNGVRTENVKSIDNYDIKKVLTQTINLYKQAVGN